MKKTKKIISTYISCLILLLSSPFVHAQETSDQEKGEIKEDPLTFNAVIQGGVFRNFSGGIKTGSDYMGRIHLTLSFDTEKAGLWKNGQFFVNGVNAHGGNPTATYIGDFQPISRNEVDVERTGLFELWYRHTFGKMSVLIGQHDMNSSFSTSKYGGNSINSAFGMNPSITPNAGPSFSIFPRTMPAVYLKYDADKITLQAAMYAGASPDFNKDPYNLHWNLDSRYLVGEAHYKYVKNGVQRGLYKLGVIHHSGDFDNVIDATQTVSGNFGAYVIADHLLIPENDNSDQGLGVFLEVGVARGNQNMIDLFSGAGILYKGLIPSRDNDALFFGFLNSSINDELVAANNTDKSRSVIELNYAMKFGEHITLQPDLQYIINPGANPTLDNAFLGVIRFSINY